MGIQKLQVKGFRSLKDVTWEPGQLNVLIGPNGSGKSNLLRALSLLQHGARGDLPQEILNQGGITPLLWDGQAREISWAIRTDPVDAAGVMADEPLTYEFVLSRLGETGVHRIERERLMGEERGGAGVPTGTEVLFERRPGHAITLDYSGQRTLTAQAGTLSDEQTLLSRFAAPFDNPVAVAFRDSLLGWSIYHDLRVDTQAPLRQAAVSRVEDRISPDGQNLIPVLHTLYSGNREFKRSLDAAMRAAFGSDYEDLVFPPAADQRIQLRLRWRSLKTAQSAANLSDGTLRFLLLVAIFASPNPGDLIALDEPETGLHPSMLPIIAELAEEASQRTQVILSTHSADLLDAFSDVALPTTTVANITEGETRLSVLDGEELRRWTDQYRLGALMRSGELEGLA
ncbi:AAA family ATPase [Vitiosangium sp. GDMCC 1.1324]|uniref:AAA family ATPase n=1 Tax=Vitiosangium sp. (strain GDMCC 1.1324) TaxID=2138576 RepID=UPI00130E3E95|nr:AAA family ATPase [Vitiosangium sp. GDMCC 1.1324]